MGKNDESGKNPGKRTREDRRKAMQRAEWLRLNSVALKLMEHSSLGSDEQDWLCSLLKDIAFGDDVRERFPKRAGATREEDRHWWMAVDAARLKREGVRDPYAEVAKRWSGMQAENLEGALKSKQLGNLEELPAVDVRVIDWHRDQ